MIKKKQLIEILNNALDNEEEANKYFYTYAINSLQYYDWLSEDKAEKIEEIITSLKVDSQKHKNILRSLIRRIQESSKNVF